jgi:cell wall-associated NlpC family hydrolase
MMNGKDQGKDSLEVVLPTDTLRQEDSFVVAKDTEGLVVNKIVINTGNIQPHDIIDFSKTLIGVKYKYGSIDPSQGFDCSGFITYVFNHFNIQVPRSSIDFTEVGRTVPRDSAKPGDLVLFTGTDSTERFVGHMGIIVSNTNGLVEFIHSTSGKAFGVTITPLSNYYLGRYARTARIFPQNERN